jgi:serine/threonine protein kinase
MAAVSHPNLAVVHGIETWQGIPFLVEEYLAGGTLARRLTASRLPIAETLALGITLAEALEQLHSAGILHCDIKPSNIGFTNRGIAKLLDFGLARLLNDARAQADVPTTMKLGTGKAAEHSAASVSGAFAGTPHYMCPEAVRGERPGPVYDVWGLSVVLFEAMAGRRPFDGDNANEIFERIATAPRGSTLRLLNDCPAPVVDLFARLLSTDSAERPQDAGTLHHELRMLRNHRLLS